MRQPLRLGDGTVLQRTAGGNVLATSPAGDQVLLQRADVADVIAWLAGADVVGRPVHQALGEQHPPVGLGGGLVLHPARRAPRPPADDY